MKIVFILLLTVNAIGETTALKLNLPGLENNTFLKRLTKTHISLSMDVKKDNTIVDFIHLKPTSSISVQLTKKSRKELLRGIEKYLDWETKAKKKKVTLQKDITNIPTGNLIFSMFKKWYFSSKRGQFKLIFFSQNKNKHQLVLRFPEMSATNNQFAKYDSKDLYFDKKSVLEMRKVLQEDFIKQKLKKALNKKKSIDKDFI